MCSGSRTNKKTALYHINLYRHFATSHNFVIFILLYVILSSLILAHGQGSSKNDQLDGQRNKKELPPPRNLSLMIQNGEFILPPRFYSRPSVCSLDSPEIFVQKFVNPVQNQLYDEVKLYFAVLMENLEPSIKNSENEKEIVKNWNSLVDSIGESLDSSKTRVEDIWERVTLECDGKPLPWEIVSHGTTKKDFLIEYLFAIQDEFQILESIVRAGTREIFGSIQVNVMTIMKYLEEKTREFMKEQGWSDKKQNETQLLEYLEKSLKEVDANLLGQVIGGLFRRAKFEKEKTEKSSKNPPNDAEVGSEDEILLSFLRKPFTDLIVLTETFISFPSVPQFWSQMTQIMLDDFVPKSRDALLSGYRDKAKDGELLKDILVVLGPR